MGIKKCRVKIFQTLPGDSLFEQFIQLPDYLYTSYTHREKTIQKIATHFLKQAYLLMQDNRLIARAALYQNPHLKYQDQKAFCIGHYECIDDTEAAAFFLYYLLDQAKGLGAEYVIGPMNGSTWEDYRFSLSHDHPNFLLEPYHFLYYNEQWRQAGFTEISMYYSSLDTQIPCDWPEIIQLEKDFEQKGVFVRSINVSAYAEELKKLYPLILKGFEKNFLYTPITWEVFYEKYISAKSLIDPGFVYIAEETNGQVVGFILSLSRFIRQSSRELDCQDGGKKSR